MGRKKTTQTGPIMLEQAIKDRIRSLGLTAYATGKMSGMSPTMIQRFLSGKRGLTLKTADKLATALDMVLVTRPESTLALDLVREREEAMDRKYGND
jgi:transcriptional regulator with XRE-family HTH domain